MRIAHITATFPPYRGGTGNVCYHNARELARRGHAVCVFTAAAGGAPEREQVAGFVVCRLRPLARLGNAPLLPGLLGALRGFDLLHLHYPFFGGEIAGLAARMYRTPLLITYHQDVLLGGAMALAERALRHTVGRAALRGAERVLFTSEDYGRASFVRPLLQGRAAHLGALPNGVDAERFTPGEPPAALRARYAPQRGDRVVLLVAGLDRAHYFKGVPVLLRALAGLPRRVRAVIVGDGDLRADYEREAARLGLAERVFFAGRVADDDLPSYYRLADVTVLPSTTMGEAFGLVLVESLACATPVVASDLPGVRTVVAHGDDGLLAPVGDPAGLARALAHVLADEPRRQAMGQAGRVKVLARYSWPAIGAQLEALYEEVLRERGRAPKLQEAGGHQ